MHEFSCVDKMIEYYKWLFEVKDEEEAREKVSERGVREGEEDKCERGREGGSE